MMKEKDICLDYINSFNQPDDVQIYKWQLERMAWREKTINEIGKCLKLIEKRLKKANKKKRKNRKGFKRC